MGHAIHTYYSFNTQPYIYADYSIFVAEVASTLNEIILSKYLIDNAVSKKEKLYIINHYLEEFRATVIRQTMFAEFEKIVHQMAENDIPLTNNEFCKIYYDLNKKYFGEDVVIDEQISYEWARIPHFYRSFYVFKYATSFSAATSISKYILEGNKKALENLKILLDKGYKNFEINYNIGCCYFKLNEYGFSRFYFEKALLYKPFDRDLYQNLLTLYNKILKNPEIGIQEIMTKRVIFFIPLFILIIMFIITFIVMFLMILIIFNFANIRKLIGILLSIFIFFNLIIIFIFFLQYSEFNKKYFVSTTTTNVYLTPNNDTTILFSIMEGTKGSIKEEFGNFIKVYLSDDTSGWIKKSDVVY